MKPVPCSTPGCKAKVPAHELPADPHWPAYCVDCLRAATPSRAPTRDRRTP